MISFAWPWIFVLLPLPMLLRGLLKPAEQLQDASLRVPLLADFELQSTATGRQQSGLRIWFWLALLAWCLLVTATARPQWLGEAVELPVSGRDLLMAVDLSGSMETRDFIVEQQQVDRLVATKYVAGQFLDRRVGDRVGLIVFGEQAYLQAPLSFDRETVKTLLYETAIGLAGDRTSIGDAIGLGIKRLKKQREKNPQQELVMILMTDGQNTAGQMEPLKAAELAAEAGIKIYTVGIGADEMMVNTLFGKQRVRVPDELDEKTLKAIADTTGGQYYRARDTAQLDRIYAKLDELEPMEKDSQYFRPVTALYAWPLGLAFVMGFFLLLVTQGNKVGWR